MTLSYVFVQVVFPRKEFAFVALRALVTCVGLRAMLELMAH
jgi:hypothetical protein